MPRYPFRCLRCQLEFEVSRPMREAGRAARCPVDGMEAQRVFTAPITAIRGGKPVATPPDATPARKWSSPFFPKAGPTGEARRPAVKPRHVLPPGSSTPTRFRHFG